MEKIFPSTNSGMEGLGMIQVHYIYCALYYYYVSSISDHQALDLEVGHLFLSRSEGMSSCFVCSRPGFDDTGIPVLLKFPWLVDWTPFAIRAGTFPQSWLRGIVLCRFSAVGCFVHSNQGYFQGKLWLVQPGTMTEVLTVRSLPVFTVPLLASHQHFLLFFLLSKIFLLRFTIPTL